MLARIVGMVIGLLQKLHPEASCSKRISNPNSVYGIIPAQSNSYSKIKKPTTSNHHINKNKLQLLNELSFEFLNHMFEL